ncbi:MAG TPA: amidohydrolase family protein [Tepidisphaeraceae bacterium]|nr:amidohydrolase family protein [Tepidisphaeraceae bacterium]
MTDPAKLPEYNQTFVNFRQPWPRAPVNGTVIDGHVHLLGSRHAESWFEAADHFGIDNFVSQTPLEEVLTLSRRWGHRLQFVAVPNWMKLGEPNRIDDWMRRLDAFANIGSKIAKAHLAPGTIKRTKLTIDGEEMSKIFRAMRDRGMIIMTHVGDPQLWYDGKYKDDAEYGTRADHYRLWSQRLEEHRGWPWLAAHLGGWPEGLNDMQGMLDRFPDLILDLSATKWIVRELSVQRDQAREFIMRNQDRLIWGSDQVSTDNRDFDFYASRWWCHRKLFETAWRGPSPILDPDATSERPSKIDGLALPTTVLQKLYHDNVQRLFSRVGVKLAQAA